MYWILAVVFVLYVWQSYRLRQVRAQLNAAKPETKPLNFGLEDLRALASAITDKKAGKLLETLLLHLNITSRIGPEYDQFRQDHQKQLEAIEDSILFNRDEICRLEERNRQSALAAEERQKRASELGELVANVLD